MNTDGVLPGPGIATLTRSCRQPPSTGATRNHASPGSSEFMNSSIVTRQRSTWRLVTRPSFVQDSSITHAFEQRLHTLGVLWTALTEDDLPGRVLQDLAEQRPVNGFEVA